MDATVRRRFNPSIRAAYILLSVTDMARNRFHFFVKAIERLFPHLSFWIKIYSRAFLVAKHLSMEVYVVCRMFILQSASVA